MEITLRPKPDELEIGYQDPVIDNLLCSAQCAWIGACTEVGRLSTAIWSHSAAETNGPVHRGSRRSEKIPEEYRFGDTTIGEVFF